MEDMIRPLGKNGLLILWQQILAQFVKKEKGKGLSTNDLTDDLLHKIQDITEQSFAGNYISLTNRPQINGIILEGNKTLDDLGITQAIREVVGEMPRIAFELFDSLSDLPQIGEAGVIYLVLNGDSDSEDNTFDEYVWIASKQGYELLGMIQNKAELSGYVKIMDIVPITNDEILSIVNNATNS